MIGCINKGGLGNCLFIWAATIAYSLKHGMPFCLPLKTENPHYPEQGQYIINGVNYGDNSDWPIYIEPSFEYKEIPNYKDVTINGYFQSWRYHYDYKSDIIKTIGFDKIETKKDVCSIHYRCGDYKHLPTKHPVISEDYLRRAINYMLFSHYRRFLVFSDDIPAIKKIIESFTWLKDVEFEYSEGNDELTDLKLMASCGSNICANSSYSWWGAYINPNPEKIITMPRKWFGEALQHDTKDLYLPNAIIL